MNIWGTNIKLSIFGESHGNGIGIVIDGLPSGTKLDLDLIEREMERRAPGRNSVSTSRREKDSVEILSGFVGGVTTGTPLCGMIRNTNTISKHYERDLLRPGHADYTGFQKYGDSHDYRGGGHFSGRITAPLVFAGAVAKQILKTHGITVGSHIIKISDICDEKFDSVNIDAKLLEELSKKDFPVCSESKAELMKTAILNAKNNCNSVGGIVECAVVGMPVGKGSPFFGSIESRISSMMFSVPAVKGIEFGAGFGFADMDGKSANDEFYIENGVIKTYSNNNAGINGGISNGMPIVFDVVMKPTPSISQVQRTVDISKMENAEIEIHGRHDPCIVHRGAVVVENAAAVAILDVLLD
ncbi:MAG: chorismate synthase [Clostridiales bacterium]|nr:chorismate synthase [Clostridiales bacterium]